MPQWTNSVDGKRLAANDLTLVYEDMLEELDGNYRITKRIKRFNYKGKFFREYIRVWVRCNDPAPYGKEIGMAESMTLEDGQPEMEPWFVWTLERPYGDEPRVATLADAIQRIKTAHKSQMESDKEDEPPCTASNPTSGSDGKQISPA
jgi:hypothetical protein